MIFLLNITPWPLLSALLWIVLVVTSLYFARPTAHKAIRAAAATLHRTFRLASAGIRKAEAALAERNREVLLAAGREAKERIVEREFGSLVEQLYDLPLFVPQWLEARYGSDPANSRSRPLREART